MATDDESKINGADIWEALFAVLKGNVPDEITDDVCNQLAAYINGEA